MIFWFFPLESSLRPLDRDSLVGVEGEEEENTLEEGAGKGKGIKVNIGEEQNRWGKGNKLHLSSWPLPPGISIETLQLVKGGMGPLKSGDLPNNSPSLCSRTFNHLSGLWLCLGDMEECGTKGTISKEW